MNIEKLNSPENDSDIISILTAIARVNMREFLGANAYGLNVHAEHDKNIANAIIFGIQALRESPDYIVPNFLDNKFIGRLEMLLTLDLIDAGTAVGAIEKPENDKNFMNL